MGYIELRKLYYRDENLYRAEYEERFAAPDAVKLDFMIKSNQAFFIQTAEMSQLIYQILRIDKEIYKLSRELPGVAIDQFTRRCLIDEIVLTNKIEGVYSTRKEISSVLDDLADQSKKKRGKMRRFTGLVTNYSKLKNNEFVKITSCSDIRQLYDEIVLPEVLEEDPQNAPDGKIFRKDSASIVDGRDKEIHRGISPESAIVENMEKALAFLNDESIESLYRIACFHYLLEYIHPFYDGNGRLGRFIVSNLLAQELEPLLAYRISYTITEHITEYYSAFKVCNDPHNLGDITPFVLMMLTMIQKSISQLEDALKSRISRLNKYNEILNGLPFGAGRTGEVAFYLVQASLFSEHGISTRILEENLNNSYSTVRKELDTIEKEGFLITKRVGKEKFYSIDIEKIDRMLLVSPQ